MKTKDLLKLINEGKKEYSDFLEWDVALEHVENPEKDINCKNDIITHLDHAGIWKFIKSHCMGCCTYFVKQKTLGLQIHY